MVSGQYSARPEAMRSAAGNVGGLLMQASRMLLDFAQPDVDPASFASIGSSVSSADAALHQQQVLALSSVLSLLQGFSSRVQQSADNYQEADAAVAESYTGEHPVIPRGPLTWSSPASAALARQATQDSATDGEPTPHRAESVIGYLAAAGLGQLGQLRQGGPLSMPVGPAGDLTAWLEDSPEHQAQIGVTAVYAGGAHDLGDTPGGLRPGDVVCIEPGADAADQDVVVGVIGDDGGLYNHGRLSPDFGSLAQVRVYRPLGAGIARGRPAGPAGPGEAVTMTEQEIPL